MELKKSKFISDNWPDSQKIDAIRSLMSPLYHVSPLKKDSKLFACMDVFNYGGMIISETSFSNHLCVRDDARASASNFDSVLIQLFKEGSITGRTRDGDFKVNRGSISIIDLSQSCSIKPLNENPTNCINIVIPKLMLENDSIRSLHGKSINSENPIAKIISIHIKGVRNAISSMDEDSLWISRQMTIDILNSGLKIFEGIDWGKEHSAKIRIEEYIKNNIQEQLTIDFLAEKFHLSRATLFRIFSKDGGVSNYIKNIKLQSCLKDVIFSRHEYSISDLVDRWGFSNEQQLSRLFKKQYGHPPLKLRESAKSGYYPIEANDLYDYLSARSNRQT